MVVRRSHTPCCESSTLSTSTKLLWCGHVVTVSNRDCDSLSLGSIPSGHPKEVYTQVKDLPDKYSFIKINYGT